MERYIKKPFSFLLVVVFCLIVISGCARVSSVDVSSDETIDGTLAVEETTTATADEIAETTDEVATTTESATKDAGEVAATTNAATSGKQTDKTNSVTAASNIAAKPAGVIDVKNLTVGDAWAARNPSNYKTFLQTSYEKSVMANPGNSDRVAAVFKKLDKMTSGTVSIGFLGGSITWGSAGGSGNVVYSELVTNWLQSLYPHLTFNAVNVSVPGTGSDYACFRVDGQLLPSNPDIVFIEYAVNDSDSEYSEETYESLCRKVLNSKQKPAVIALEMSRNYGHDTSINRYDIPCIHHNDAISSWENEWYLSMTTDGIHPNKLGQEFLADMLVKYLAEVCNNRAQNKTPNYTLPAPVTRSRYEDAGFLRGVAYGNIPAYVPPVMTGDWGERTFDKFYDNLGHWVCRDYGTIEFKVTAGLIYLQISTNMDIANHGGYARIYVDNVEIPGGTNAYSIGSRLIPLVDDGVKREHTIRLVYDSEPGQTLSIGGIMYAQR